MDKIYDSELTRLVNDLLGDVDRLNFSLPPEHVARHGSMPARHAFFYLARQILIYGKRRRRLIAECASNLKRSRDIMYSIIDRRRRLAASVLTALIQLCDYDPFLCCDGEVKRLAWLNCPPVLLPYETKIPPCGMWFCPHCRVRTAWSLYQQLEPYFPKRGHSRWQIFTTTHNYSPKELAIEQPHLIATPAVVAEQLRILTAKRRAPFRLPRRLKLGVTPIIGGASTLLALPWDQGKSWRIRRRDLLILPNGDKVPAAFKKQLAKPRGHATRKNLVRALGYMFAYPTALFAPYSPGDEWYEVLVKIHLGQINLLPQANGLLRQGRAARQVATFGAFRANGSQRRPDWS